MSFSSFLIKRTIHGIFVIWGVVSLTFFLRVFTPGNPIDLILPPTASTETRESLRESLGLTEPLYVQYLDYLMELLQFDLGYSYISGISVNAIILQRLPATLELAVSATIISVVIAIPLGIISARYRHGLPDFGATVFSLVGISTPNFWLGVMLILLFGEYFGLLPTSTRQTGLWEAVVLASSGNPNGIINWIRHITLPAITLGTYYTALITRLTRSGMLDELGKQYILALEAKGLPAVLKYYKHALKNTLIPIITVLGLQLGGLIGGSVITEAVFVWPGLGTTLIKAVNFRDWTIIQGVLVLVGSGYVVVNIVVDALYAKIDPRVTHE